MTPPPSGVLCFWPLPPVTTNTLHIELHEADIGAALSGVSVRNPVAKIGSAVALYLLFSAVAIAQTVPGSLTLRWTLPTTGCLVGADPPVCNVPLTGGEAIQAVHVWISTSPIPDRPTAAPTLTLAAGATTASHTMQVTNGQTLYARVAARGSADGKLSAQVTRLIAIPVAPGVPTNVTVELVISAQ